MALDLTNGYAELREHIGHEIVCVCYGPQAPRFRALAPANVALECETCACVLIDFDQAPNGGA